MKCKQCLVDGTTNDRTFAFVLLKLVPSSEPNKQVQSLPAGGVMRVGPPRSKI